VSRAYRPGQVLDEGVGGRGRAALGCWPWLGALSRPDGRALLHDPDLDRPTQAARIAWQLSHHPVPDGLQVLHLCDHPWCVRPTHLVLGSPAANMADRARKQ
jgi:hypothetical protein